MHKDFKRLEDKVVAIFWGALELLGWGVALTLFTIIFIL